MIWILVAVGALVLSLFPRGKIIGGTEAAVLGAIIGVAVYLLGGMMTATLVPVESYIHDQTGIVSLDTQSTISGRFFLGCGSIGSEAQYFYYEPVNEDTYKLGNIPASQAVIVEDVDQESDTGYVQEYWPTWRSLFWSLQYPITYELHVPEGSIVQEFDANVIRMK